MVLKDREKFREVLLNNMLGLGLQLLLGVCVTAFFTYYINWKITDVQTKFAKTLSEKQKMEDVAFHLTEMMYARLWRMNRLIYHYQSPTYSEDRNKLRNEYTDIVDKWNSSLGNNERNIELYFGKENLSFFNSKINQSFLEIHEEFRKIMEKFKQNQTTQEEVNKSLNVLRPKIVSLTESIGGMNKNMKEEITRKIEAEKN